MWIWLAWICWVHSSSCEADAAVIAPRLDLSSRGPLQCRRLRSSCFDVALQHRLEPDIRAHRVPLSLAL